MADAKPPDKPAKQEEVAVSCQLDQGPVPPVQQVPSQAALLRALRWLKTESAMANLRPPEDPPKPKGK